MIDKNKLKEKIQKTPTKDIQYMTFSPVEILENKKKIFELQKQVSQYEVRLILMRET
jgi:primase-polymerase (primpol)-like protein